MSFSPNPSNAPEPRKVSTRGRIHFGLALQKAVAERERFVPAQRLALPADPLGVPFLSNSEFRTHFVGKVVSEGLGTVPQTIPLGLVGLFSFPTSFDSLMQLTRRCDH
jgi:hypothetical protein